MTKNKPSAIVYRKANEKDLPKLNREFGLGEQRFQEKDLDNLLTIEINGEIRAIAPYEKEQGFKGKANDPTISFMAKTIQETESRNKNPSHLDKLLKKYGSKKAAEMYEDHVEKLLGRKEKGR